ncbi:peptidoglycan-binding domain-containing protein [Luteibacter sp. 3190]|uniref:peptidoglycan-binding domain-containing protein n=1 Tax=Luteibacter sp. 3190 TaxID=2817736 RepID=UPI002866870E|nr:peptidoglycan-binding domain-containing protein [Luteibacter sp. 3190]MDR6938207.1 hypothetical protein [Luteibacter sp. 3190]
MSAIAYFAVGVSSEGSYAGKDRAYKLSFAGKFDSSGRMSPIENSGLSYGTLQKDLGQAGREHVAEIFDAYQVWALAHSPADVLSDDERAQAEVDFARTGRQVKKENGRPLNLSTKEKVDRFLDSEHGRDLVHRSDRVEVNGLVAGPLRRLASTPAFLQASSDDRVRLAVVVAKAYNQNRVKTNELLDYMADGGKHPRTLNSLEDVISHTEDFSDAMRTGRDTALKAAELLIGLRESRLTNPLRVAWETVISDPLIAPSEMAKKGNSEVRLHHSAVRNLFLDPERSKAFLESVDQGFSHQYGRPLAENGRPATSGFYSSGTALVLWNSDGRGVAHVDGSWFEFSRKEISRLRNEDRSIDLLINRDGQVQHLLHVDTPSRSVQRNADRSLRKGMQGDDVRALQQDLARLGYTDARGRPLRQDGDFGTTTNAAVQAFQRDHRLAVDGVVGAATMASIRELARQDQPSIGQPDMVYPGYNRQADALEPYHSLRPTPLPLLLKPSLTQPESDPAAERVQSIQVPAVSRPYFEHAMERASGAGNLGTENAGRESYGLSPARGAPQAKIDETHSIEWRDQVRQPHVEHQASYDVRSLASSGEREAQTQPGRDLNDPRNPESAYHGLYRELGRRVPYASEDRLVQFTAACHTSRITADNLSICHLDERNLTMGFLGNGPLSLPVTVDLKKAPPEPEQAVAQIAQYDQQQAQVRAEYLAQQQQMSRSGPSL